MSTSIIEPGARLAGRYRLEERVSESGGSTLWKAIDEILARAVAVRTFDPDFPRAGEVVTAARAASRLTDPRLTQVFDADDSGESAYVVSEWAVGESLEEMLAKAPLEPGRAATLLYEAAEAVAAAHAAGLAHLCMSPRDLLWTTGGTVKLLGIAVEAVLADCYADDPALEDTQGVGKLLYAAVTAHWPGDPAKSDLPPAPEVEQGVCAPRQVQAGVPLALDKIICRALGAPLEGGQEALTTPAELAKALRGVPRTPLPLFAGPALGPPPAVVHRPPRPTPSSGNPPAPDPVRPAHRETAVPTASPAEAPPPPRSRTRAMPSSHEAAGATGPAGATRPSRSSRRGSHGSAATPPPPPQARLGLAGGGPAHAGARPPISRPLIALGAAAVTVIIGISAWAIMRSDGDGNGAKPSGKPPQTGSNQGGKAPAKLSIKGAQALDEPRPGHEGNRDTTIHKDLEALHDGRSSSVWVSQSYANSEFGNYLKGLGVRLDMGSSVTIDRIRVNVPGAGAGANLQVKVGDDESPDLMQPLGERSTTAGVFEVRPGKTTRGRYILLWFTSLPPGGKKAQLGEVTVYGSAG